MTPQNEILDDIYDSCVRRAIAEVAPEHPPSRLIAALIRHRARRYFEEYKQQILLAKEGIRQ